MNVTAESPALAVICAQAFSSVNDMRKALINELRAQGYKAVLSLNGYIHINKNTLWLTNRGWNYWDDNLNVGDKFALLGGDDKPISIEITSIEKLAWCDRIEYGFKVLQISEVKL